MPTKKGTVKSVSKAKSGSNVLCKAEFTYPDEPPPGNTTTVEFDPLDPEFYDDFRAAHLAGSELEVDWTAGPPATVNGVGFGT